MIRVLVCLFVSMALSSCAGFNDDEGWFVNKADDYLDAKERRDLIVPEDLDPNRVQDPFPIPPSPAQSNPEFYPGRPPRLDHLARNFIGVQNLGPKTSKGLAHRALAGSDTASEPHFQHQNFASLWFCLALLPNLVT